MKTVTIKRDHDVEYYTPDVIDSIAKEHGIETVVIVNINDDNDYIRIIGFE